MSYSLGVDVGTTFIAAAIARDARVAMVPLGNRSVLSPAAIHLRDDGTLQTGDAAARRAMSRPDRVVPKVKRRLGDPTPVLLGGAPHAVPALFGRLIADVVAHVTADNGGPPAHSVLTYPATWGPFRRELFQEVLLHAGLTRATTVTEPEAAALHHAASGRLNDGETVAIYDLGGGTFDATVVRKRRDGIDILGTPESIERLGGTDFDDAVLSHVDTEIGGALADLDLTDQPMAAALSRLHHECVLAKEALSTDVEVTIPILLPDRSTEVHLTRAAFERRIHPLLESTIAALLRALDAANVTRADLSSVLLIGGSSRIPLVARMVEAALGRPIVVDPHPQFAVALGAAVLAGTPDAAASVPQRTADAGPDRATPRRPSPVPRQRPAAPIPAVPASASAPIRQAPRPPASRPAPQAPASGQPMPPAPAPPAGRTQLAPPVQQQSAATTFVETALYQTADYHRPDPASNVVLPLVETHEQRSGRPPPVASSRRRIGLVAVGAIVIVLLVAVALIGVLAVNAFGGERGITGSLTPVSAPGWPSRPAYQRSSPGRCRSLRRGR